MLFLFVFALFEQIVCVLVSNIFYFHPYLGKIPILTNVFQRGLVQPPTSCVLPVKNLFTDKDADRGNFRRILVAKDCLCARARQAPA